MKQALLTTDASVITAIPLGMAGSPARAESFSYQYVNGQMVDVCCNSNGYCYQKK